MQDSEARRAYPSRIPAFLSSAAKRCRVAVLPSSPRPPLMTITVKLCRAICACVRDSVDGPGAYPRVARKLARFARAARDGTIRAAVDRVAERSARAGATQVQIQGARTRARRQDGARTAGVYRPSAPKLARDSFGYSRPDVTHTSLLCSPCSQVVRVGNIVR